VWQGGADVDSERIFDALIMLGYGIEIDSSGRISAILARTWPEYLPQPPKQLSGQIERDGTLSWTASAQEVEQVLWVKRVIQLRKRTSDAQLRFDF
jgi:hypothetical protein